MNVYKLFKGRLTLNFCRKYFPFMYNIYYYLSIINIKMSISKRNILNKNIKTKYSLQNCIYSLVIPTLS